MEEDLLAHLVSASALGALVYDRIQWGIRDEVAPSVALHLIDAPPDWTLQGPSGLVQARVQIDAWAETFLEAKAVGNAAVAALPAIGQIVGATKFLSCVVLDIERDTAGAHPNFLHRTRTDVRVSFRPA